MTKEQNDYITYRLQRATDTLNDAKLLAENERWNSSINRIYYACFYAVSALLYFHSIEAKTHKGVRIKFMSEFIKTGLFDKDFGKLFSDLFDWRQEGDYSDFISFDKDLTIPLITKSEEFITLIEEFLNSKEMLISPIPNKGFRGFWTLSPASSFVSVDNAALRNPLLGIAVTVRFYSSINLNLEF